MLSFDTAAVVFAHEGGWDEMLLVGGPIVVIGILLAVANRRAKELDVNQTQTPATPSSGAPASGTASGHDTETP